MNSASAPEIAVVVGKSCRAVEKAFAKIARGFSPPPWLGYNAKLIAVHGRGGRAGFRYQVRIDSLPLDLQERLKERSAPELPLFRETDHRAAERNWYLTIIRPALPHPPRSAERRAAIDAILSRPLTDWHGEPITLSRRTIERRLAAYETQGVAAFAPRVRADKGVRKVLISLAAEQAIPFDDETWEGIASKLRDYIRGHWKANATLKLIQAHANVKFRELIEATGFDHCHTLPDSTFIVPRRFIEAERAYRNVAILHKDRKRYEDNRFRTERSRAGMVPMDWIVGDVHPVDIVMTRADGSTAHARTIAWLDVATNRLRFDLVLCEPGTGIRNADLIQSFCRMLADPAWGMPKTLYIDNGREYRFAEDMNDALQLVAQLRGDDGRTTRIRHARPYNAAAKPIESMFAALERWLQDMPGHTGGDRMNKKTERVGRPTLPYAGELSQLAADIQARLTIAETMPMRGALAGKSPRQAYQAAIDSGWQPVAVDPAEILTVFSADRVCKITKGVIAYDNRRWHCDELASYFEDKIIARTPRFWSAEKLALLHIKTRALVGIAEPVGAVVFDDVSGARISHNKDKRRRAAIRKLDRSAPDIDTVQESLRIASAIPPLAIAAPVATVAVSSEAAAVARELTETPAARADRQRQKNLKEQRRQSRAMDEALRLLKGGKE